MASIEKKVAKTILQERQTVTVAGVQYEVGQPSIATLIKVSSIVSTIPALNIDNNKVLEQAIAVSPLCGRQIADIVATIILGVKKPVLNMPEFTFKGCFQRVFCRSSKIAYNRLFNALLYETTPKELTNLVIRLLAMMQIEDFFGITISLNEINLIRPTMEMVTTAHGQSLQEQPKDSE